MSDDCIKYAAQVQHSRNQEVLGMVMRIQNPQSRVRAYLVVLRHSVRVRTKDLAELLNVSPYAVKRVLKSLHYQYGGAWKRDGYWYPSAKTLGGRDV